MITARVGERLLDQGRDRVLDLGRRTLGPRLEALLQDGREFVGLARLRPPAAAGLDLGLPASPWPIPCSLAYLSACGFAAALAGASLSAAISLRIGQQLLELVLGRDLAVHVAQQIGELLARLQQLGDRRAPAGRPRPG